MDPVVRFKRIDSPPGYEVHVDGNAIGTVYKTEVVRSHKPHGSRIVTHRTTSERWTGATKDGRRVGGGWYPPTRRRATALLLESELGISHGDALALAEKARDYWRHELAQSDRWW